MIGNNEHDAYDFINNNRGDGRLGEETRDWVLEGDEKGGQ